MEAETTSEHPMDDFPIRALEFDIAALKCGDGVWSKSSPEFALFINALGVHVPYFERYLIHSMNVIKNKLDRNTKLYRDMVALSAQEGHHARNFISYNKFLGSEYPRVAKYEEEAREHFRARARTDPTKRLVGFTAGYETFTFLAGLIILQNYKSWLEDSNAIVKALWVWHQVEEVEHGAVAHDVYRALYGKHEWYRKYMVVLAGAHILKETAKSYFAMMWYEGYFKNPLRAAKGVAFLISMSAKMAWQTRPVFRKKYNPRNHPLATNRQDPVAIAWRKFDKGGGNVLAIDRNAMTKILKL